MKFNKWFIVLALVAAAALFITESAQAQAYSYQAISLPATLSGTTNFATPITIGPLKQDKLAFSFTVSSTDASSTTNVTFTGAWSVDGVNVDTNNSVTLTASMLAGKPCTTATNTLTSSGRGYFVIWSEQIGANSKITNNAASYGIKLNSP